MDGHIGWQACGLVPLRGNTSKCNNRQTRQERGTCTQPTSTHQLRWQAAKVCCRLAAAAAAAGCCVAAAAAAACSPAARQPVPAQQQRLRLLLKAPGEGGMGALVPLQQRGICDHCSRLLCACRSHSCLCAVDAPAGCKREGGKSRGAHCAPGRGDRQGARNLDTHNLLRQCSRPACLHPLGPPAHRAASHAARGLQAACLPGVLGKRAVHFGLPRLEHGVGHLRGCGMNGGRVSQLTHLKWVQAAGGGKQRRCSRACSKEWTPAAATPRGHRS